MHARQIFEVATATLAVTINHAGRYRIDVDPRNAVTTIVVWKGAGEAYGDNSSFRLRAGDTVHFCDTDLCDCEIYSLPGEDDFNRYCLDRDQRLAHAASPHYIDDVVGYADLDEYGSWRPASGYGSVWFPCPLDADWAQQESSDSTLIWTCSRWRCCWASSSASKPWSGNYSNCGRCCLPVYSPWLHHHE